MSTKTACVFEGFRKGEDFALMCTYHHFGGILKPINVLGGMSIKRLKHFTSFLAVIAALEIIRCGYVEIRMR